MVTQRFVLGWMALSFPASGQRRLMYSKYRRTLNRVGRESVAKTKKYLFSCERAAYSNWFKLYDSLRYIPVTTP